MKSKLEEYEEFLMYIALWYASHCSSAKLEDTGDYHTSPHGEVW